MADPGGQAKRLRQLLAAARPETRYIDLALHLRRITADFPAPVEEGHEFTAGGVAFVALAAGQVGVPVRSLDLGASAAAADGAPIEGGGELRAEVLVRGGGRWDTLRREMAPEPPERPVCFDLMESQVEVARWFAAWLARYLARSRDWQRARDVRTLLNYGNRGGGKTVVLLLCLVCFCLSVSGAIGWAISRSRPQAEVDITRTLQQLLPASWYVYRGHPKYSYSFVNGSLLRDMTADSPEDLKQGRVDLALLNEGAKMDRRAYAYPLGRVKDRGGLMMIASNPPTPDVPKGAWVKRLYEDEREARAAGKWFPMHVVRTDAALNAAIDQAAGDDVAILLHAVDPALAVADALGEMAAIGQRLIYAYDKVLHGMEMPPDVGYRDITEQVTHRLYNRAFPYLAGVDFQDHPFIIASFYKVYEDPARPTEPILWCISEFARQGSEDDFLDEVIDQGIQVSADVLDGKRVVSVAKYVDIEPGTVLWVGDSSAQWQDRKNRGSNITEPPSFKIWRNRGLFIVPPTKKITPEAKFAKNPPRGTSYGQVNRWFATGRLKLSPLAEKLSEACRECLVRPGVNGNPLVGGKHVHPIDTLRYVCWYIEPPTKIKAPVSGGSAGAGSISIARPR